MNLIFIRIIFKILILFISSFLFRICINNGLYTNLLSFLFFILSINCINEIIPIYIPTGIFSFNIRPRDKIINNDYNFKEKCKRKVEWKLFWQFNEKYKSYEEYIKQWDNNTKIRNELYNKYNNTKYKIKIIKKTLLWFIGPKNGS